MIRRLKAPPELTDAEAVSRLLMKAGLSPPAAAPKGELFASAAQLVRRRSDRAELHAFYVPGRIEVLGKHTDYAGGSSMLVAVERGFCLVAAPRADNMVRITDVVLDETIQFPLDADLQPRVGHWSNYPMTVARRVARNFPGIGRGAEVAFGSDLPVAAGLSSSSVMIVAVFLAMAELNELWTWRELTGNVRDLPELAGYLACVENGQTFGTLVGDRGVGTVGGSEDHTAMLCCHPGRLDEYSYCPVRFRRWLPMPAGYVFAVGSSGVVAEKTGAAMEKYNRASRLAWSAAALWRRATGRDDPHLAAALASAADAPQRIAEVLRGAQVDEPGITPEALLARFDHFRIEDGQLRPQAGDALARGDLEAFGRFTDQSQRLAEELLGNQVPETMHLARSARQLGAVASLAFGAGFGGSVWALVASERIDRFLADWRDDYRQRFPQHASAAQFFATGAGPAALQVA
ncbi:MAG TPA: galactokinase [Planctomycetaceae bacterium]|nr:galactokinase [Planctomycetaceae bacterium]